MKYLDCTGSKKVYGKIGSDWTAGDTLGEHVTELMIGKTNVGFDVPERQARARRFFPKLTIVSVKGSKLAMDVWEFLYPFSSIPFLKKVDASGCDLFGTVHTLSGESGLLVQWQFCSNMRMSRFHIFPLGLLWQGFKQVVWVASLEEPHARDINV